MTVGLKSCIYSFASFLELEHALLHRYKGFKSPAFLICSLVLRERKREGHVTVKKECIATGVFFLRGPLGALHPSFVILLKVFSQWVSLPLCLFCRKDFIAFGVFCLFNFFLCWVGFATFFRVYGTFIRSLEQPASIPVRFGAETGIFGCILELRTALMVAWSAPSREKGVKGWCPFALVFSKVLSIITVVTQ